MNTYEPKTIRQQCIEEHQQLLEQAIASLTAKGCVVHQAIDADQAATIVAQLCPSEQKAMCTFAPELEEVSLAQIIPQMIQTDLEALVAQKLNRPYVNPRRAPLDDTTPEQITEILQQYLGNTEPMEPANLMAAVSKKIKVDADQCDWGITGADAIAADTGTLILAEDQGNGRIVSNIPTRHMAIVGLEKLYPSNETVLDTIHAAWTAGGRQSAPVYYSYITGPSRTGDIEGSMVCGMHGPQQVHVVLLDNGRSTLFAQNKGRVLQCIECGRCTAALEQLAAGQHTPAPLTCKSLALANLQNPLQISDDQWAQLDFQCPVGITRDDLKQAMQ